MALDHGMASTPYPMGFGCRKEATAGRRSAGLGLERSVPDWRDGASRVRDCVSLGLQVPASVTPETQLDYAKRLAEAGRLAEAAAVCEAHLDQNRASADAYFLLGRVRGAGGDLRAGDCFRKALYLEPNHYESLMQLALLAEKGGDAKGARQYRRRAQRAKGTLRSL